MDDSIVSRLVSCALKTQDVQWFMCKPPVDLLYQAAHMFARESRAEQKNTNDAQ